MQELHDSDALHEARAVQKLAAALWFAHSKLQESLETKLSNMESVHAELSEIEVDRDRIRGMLELKLTEISELNLEVTTAKKVITSERAEHDKELFNEQSSNGEAVLKIANLNTQLAQLAEKLTQYALSEENWEATENRLRAKIHEITIFKNRNATKIEELQIEISELKKEDIVRRTQGDKKEELIAQLKRFQEAHSGCTTDAQSEAKITEMSNDIARLKQELRENAEGATRERLALEAANRTFSERLNQTRGSHKAIERKLMQAIETREELEEAYADAQHELEKNKGEAAVMLQRFEAQGIALKNLNQRIEEMKSNEVLRTNERKNQKELSPTEGSDSDKENRAPGNHHALRYSGSPGVRQGNFRANERPTSRDPIPESARIQKGTLGRGKETRTNHTSDIDRRRSRPGQTQESGTGSDTEGEDRRTEAFQLLKVRKQLSAIKPTGQTSSHGDTEPSWGLLNEMRKNNMKNDNRSKGKTHPDRRDEFPKSVKTINQMISKFRKNGAVNILEHIILFERLMKTLGMISNEELIKYLPWTFEDKLQAFFLELDSESYPEWREFRAEVIKNFSTHRNKHEALLHALAMKCQTNQNPREFFHELKKAFAQVYTVVNTESEEFRRTLFHGMPESTKAHMAGSYSDRKSSQWIMEQAKSIYDVSRTIEPDKGYKKPLQQDKKVSEISSQKEQLPFESGKPNRQNETKNEMQRQYQQPRDNPRQNVENPQRRDPNDMGIGRELGVNYYVSRNYTGSRPIKDFKYRAPDKSGQSSGEERRQRQHQGGRQSPPHINPQNDGNAGRQNRERMPYPQGQQRANYDPNQGGQKYVRYSERNDERMAKVEQALDHLAKMMFNSQMAAQAQQRQNVQAVAQPQN